MDICIMNSGFGSRLKKYTQDVPKGMVPLDDGTTILSRQLEILRKSGNHRYVITTGYLDGMIQGYLGKQFPDLDITYLVNTRYASTNYIASLELLNGLFVDSIILLHGDLVFEESVARDIIDSPFSTVAVDSSLPLPAKDFKARIHEGKVIEIGIDVFGTDCLACQPMYRLTKGDWNRWQQEIHTFCARGEESVYAEHALNRISSQLDIRPLDVKGRLCMEIDNEEDLMTARGLLEKQNG